MAQVPSVSLALGVAALLAGLGCGRASAAGLQFTDGGLQIEAGAMGTFLLEWPSLEAGGDQRTKPNDVKLAGQTATLGYAGGQQLTAALGPDGLVTYTFAQRPAGVTHLRWEGLLDFNLAEGGTWSVDGAAAQPFPPQQLPKPQFFQDNARRLEIVDNQGRALAVTLPNYSWLQLQDNREWGWKIFHWFFQAPIGDALSFTLQVAQRDSGGAPRLVVDRLGQDAQSDWPGKMQNEAELRTDPADEAAWTATLPEPVAQNRFGGLAGSGAALGLTATGFFHTQKVAGRWYLVDPAGDAFFKLSPCVLSLGDDYTYIEGREGIYEWLPAFDSEFRTAFRGDDRTALSFYAANVIRKTGQPFDAATWAESTIERLRSWGFNSGGAFSGTPHEALTAKSFPYVGHLPLDPWGAGIARIPGLTETWDPYDQANLDKMAQAFARDLPARANDPLLIGYYLINEPAYQDIPRVVPTLDGTFACKRALVDLLRAKYADIAAFNTAWGLTAGAFDDLLDQGLAITTPAAAADMQAYYQQFLERLFSVTVAEYRRHDANHMLLGNRYQSITINNEPLCRITGQYVDVLSFNYYTHYLDKDFLAKVSRWAGDKPLLLSEFHWASPSDSGLPGGARDVTSQAERGLAYRNYVEQAASTGLVLGIEWFTLIDQARTGRWFSRYNGENGNTGLLSVVDRPWRAMIESMARTHREVYDVWQGRAAPFVYTNPRFAGSGATAKVARVMRATGPIALDGTTAGWPGLPAEEIPSSRVAQGADAGGVSATFRLAWDDQDLHLLVNVVDPTPRQNQHQGAGLWEADGAEVFIGPEAPEQTGPLLFEDRQILLSAGTVDGQTPYFWGNAPAQVPLRLVSLPGADGGSYVLQAAIPWRSLGLQPAEGLRLRFDLAIDDSADGQSRRSQLVWSGTERNSGDRTHWGTAVLAP